MLSSPWNFGQPSSISIRNGPPAGEQNNCYPTKLRMKTTKVIMRRIPKQKSSHNQFATSFMVLRGSNVSSFHVETSWIKWQLLLFALDRPPPKRKERKKETINCWCNKSSIFAIENTGYYNDRLRFLFRSCRPD